MKDATVEGSRERVEQVGDKDMVIGKSVAPSSLQILGSVAYLKVGQTLNT